MDRAHEHRDHLEDNAIIGNDEIFNEEMSDDDELSMSIEDEGVPYDKIWNQIVANDPNLTSLNLGYWNCPPDGDWARLGRVIARSAHLEELTMIFCVSLN